MGHKMLRPFIVKVSVRLLSPMSQSLIIKNAKREIIENLINTSSYI